MRLGNDKVFGDAYLLRDSLHFGRHTLSSTSPLNLNRRTERSHRAPTVLTDDLRRRYSHLAAT